MSLLPLWGLAARPPVYFPEDDFHSRRPLRTPHPLTLEVWDGDGREDPFDREE